jgi:hypothetical protein
VRARTGHHGASAIAATLLITAGSWTIAPAFAATPHKVTEHVTLKLVKRTGSTKFEHKGRATGTASGAVHSRITIRQSVLMSGTVTIATSKGKLTLKVKGRARSLERYSRFDGSAWITGGTGHYANARGRGTFKGVVNRSTWAATLDASGSYTTS